MPIGNLEKVIVKQFSPEQAGELVGWVNVIEMEESELIIASVAYATVSSNGAEYTYLIDEQGKKYSEGITGNGVGFEGSTELSVSGRDGEIADTYPSKSPGIDIYQKLVSRNKEDTGFANSFYKHQGSPVDSGEWAVGNEEIVSTIKTELDKRDARWLYPTIYYYLAQMAKPGAVVADPTMHDTTTRQELQNAREVSKATENIRNADEAMLKDLTVFGSIKPENIVARFIESRRHVRELERKLAETKAKMVSGKRYLRLSDVRTWPYMDPTEYDERKAFGAELHGLQNDNIEPARYQLEAELRAAKKRQEDSNHLLYRLSALSAKEVELSAV